MASSAQSNGWPVYCSAAGDLIALGFNNRTVEVRRWTPSAAASTSTTAASAFAPGVALGDSLMMMDADAPLRGVALLYGGRRLLVCTSRALRLFVCEVESSQLKQCDALPLPSDARVDCFAVSRTAAVLAVRLTKAAVAKKNAIALQAVAISIDGLRQVSSRKTNQTVTAMALRDPLPRDAGRQGAPDTAPGDLLLASRTETGTTVHICTVRDEDGAISKLQRLGALVQGGAKVTSLAWISDGEIAACGSIDGHISVYRCNITGPSLGTFQCSADVRALVAGAGAVLVAGTASGDIVECRVRSGAPAGSVLEHVATHAPQHHNHTVTCLDLVSGLVVAGYAHRSEPTAIHLDGHDAQEREAKDDAEMIPAIPSGHVSHAANSDRAVGQSKDDGNDDSADADAAVEVERGGAALDVQMGDKSQQPTGHTAEREVVEISDDDDDDEEVEAEQNKKAEEEQEPVHHGYAEPNTISDATVRASDTVPSAVTGVSTGAAPISSTGVPLSTSVGHNAAAVSAALHHAVSILAKIAPPPGEKVATRPKTANKLRFIEYVPNNAGSAPSATAATGSAPARDALAKAALAAGEKKAGTRAKLRFHEYVPAVVGRVTSTDRDDGMDEDVSGESDGTDAHELPHTLQSLVASQKGRAPTRRVVSSVEGERMPLSPGDAASDPDGADQAGPAVAAEPSAEGMPQAREGTGSGVGSGFDVADVETQGSPQPETASATSEAHTGPAAQAARGEQYNTSAAAAPAPPALAPAPAPAAPAPAAPTLAAPALAAPAPAAPAPAAPAHRQSFSYEPSDDSSDDDDGEDTGDMGDSDSNSDEDDAVLVIAQRPSKVSLPRTSPSILPEASAAASAVVVARGKTQSTAAANRVHSDASAAAAAERRAASTGTRGLLPTELPRGTIRAQLSGSTVATTVGVLSAASSAVNQTAQQTAINGAVINAQHRTHTTAASTPQAQTPLQTPPQPHWNDMSRFNSGSSSDVHAWAVGQGEAAGEGTYIEPAAMEQRVRIMRDAWEAFARTSTATQGVGRPSPLRLPGSVSPADALHMRTVWSNWIKERAAIGLMPLQQQQRQAPTATAQQQQQQHQYPSPHVVAPQPVHHRPAASPAAAAAQQSYVAQALATGPPWSKSARQMQVTHAATRTHPPARQGQSIEHPLVAPTATTTSTAALHHSTVAGHASQTPSNSIRASEDDASQISSRGPSQYDTYSQPLVTSGSVSSGEPSGTPASLLLESQQRLTPVGGQPAGDTEKEYTHAPTALHNQATALPGGTLAAVLNAAGAAASSAATSPTTAASSGNTGSRNAKAGDPPAVTNSILSRTTAPVKVLAANRVAAPDLALATMKAGACPPAHETASGSGMSTQATETTQPASVVEQPLPLPAAAAAIKAKVVPLARAAAATRPRQQQQQQQQQSSISTTRTSAAPPSRESNNGHAASRRLSKQQQQRQHALDTDSESDEQDAAGVPLPQPRAKAASKAPAIPDVHHILCSDSDSDAQSLDMKAPSGAVHASQPSTVTAASPAPQIDFTGGTQEDTRKAAKTAAVLATAAPASAVTTPVATEATGTAAATGALERTKAPTMAAGTTSAADAAANSTDTSPAATATSATSTVTPIPLAAAATTPAHTTDLGSMPQSSHVKPLHSPAPLKQDSAHLVRAEPASPRANGHVDGPAAKRVKRETALAAMRHNRALWDFDYTASVEQWSVADVIAWLTRNGFAAAATRAAEVHLNGCLFLELEESMLEEINITSRLQQRRFSILRRELCLTGV